MTFISLPFAVLFTITLILVAFTKGTKTRQTILLISSMIMYAWWDIRFLFLLIFVCIVSWYCALKINETRDSKIRGAYLKTGIVLPLMVLGFFKYFNFFMDSLINRLHIGSYNTLNIILPIGISFYSFQAISYVVDVYRGKIEARKSLKKVTLYIAFFPQLVAGPIVRSSTFLPQLDDDHDIELQNIETGLQIFLIGMVKKVVIADRLSVFVDTTYKTPNVFSGATLLLAAIAYSVQIYCDFSGYSDMAIGVAKAFGYDLCKNFDYPYMSKNPRELWKRWHISLSSWLTDYLYIGLGGNRRGSIRTYVNLLLTMILSGLWHGANWNFVLWGTIHGVILVLHRLLTHNNKENENHSLLPNIACTLATFVFTTFCWIIFRNQSLENAILIYRRIFTMASGVSYPYIYAVIFIFIIVATHIIGYVKNNGEYKYNVLDLSQFKNKFLLCLEIGLIVLFAYGGDTAFIYFQF